MSVQAYGRLWEMAQPHPLVLPREALEGASEEIQVRRVPWQAIREGSLSFRHGQTVVLPDAVLLIWLQEDHLYLLRSPREQDRLS